MQQNLEMRTDRTAALPVRPPHPAPVAASRAGTADRFRPAGAIPRPRAPSRFRRRRLRACELLARPALMVAALGAWPFTHQPALWWYLATGLFYLLGALVLICAFFGGAGRESGLE